MEKQSSERIRNAPAHTKPGLEPVPTKNARYSQNSWGTGLSTENLS